MNNHNDDTKHPILRLSAATLHTVISAHWQVGFFRGENFGHLADIAERAGWQDIMLTWREKIGGGVDEIQLMGFALTFLSIGFDARALVDSDDAFRNLVTK
jgi:hypothetical protein